MIRSSTVSSKRICIHSSCLHLRVEFSEESLDVLVFVPDGLFESRGTSFDLAVERLGSCKSASLDVGVPAGVEGADGSVLEGVEELGDYGRADERSEGTARRSVRSGYRQIWDKERGC